MSQPPQHPGSGEQPGFPPPQGQPGPQGPPPGQPPGQQPGQPQQPGPYGPPPGQNPYGQNPYSQPPQPHPQQPLWQGHQAPQQHPQGWQQPQPVAPRKGRKGWLIALLVLLVVALLAGGILGVLALTNDDADSGLEVSDIEAGDCLRSSDFEGGEASVGGIERVDCDEAHDAEVFGVIDAGDGEDLTVLGTRCVEVAEEEEHPLASLQADDLEVRPLAAGDEPAEGDPVVCFVRHKDGETLTDQIFD